MEGKQLVHEATDVLEKLIYALQGLHDGDFTNPIAILSGSTIGEHTRHIIELFQCLLNGYEQGVVNYDNRKRDYILQTEMNAAVKALHDIILNLPKPNKSYVLQSMGAESNIVHIHTNYHRELLYNIEHCVHHQALIKVGLLAIDKHSAHNEFGIAKSTLAFRQSAAVK